MVEKVQKTVNLLERDLQGLPMLEGDYTDSRITNGGLKKLVKCNPQIRILDLSSTRIGDAGIPHLCRLKQLESVNLNSTHVTDKGVDMLAKALPNCQIAY